MARIINQTSIRTARARIGRAPVIGPSINRLARTVQTITGEALAAQRKDEASLAAQQLEFKRDDQGHLIAPETPGQEKFLGPSIYDQQYAMMVTNRYKQQLQVDYTEGVNRIANNNPRDPQAFEAAVEAYRQSFLENVMPEVAADIQLDLDTQIVQYANQIDGNKAEFEFKQSQDQQLLTIQNGSREIAGAVTAGMDPEQISTMVVQQKEVILEGLANSLYNEAYVNQEIQDLERVIFRASISKRFDGVEPTREAHAQAMVDIQDMIDGDAEIAVPVGGVMKMVKVNEVFPSIDERQQVFQQVQQLIQGRESVRAALERATWDRQTRTFMLEDVQHIEDAITTGDPFSDSMTRKVDEALSLAVASNNLALQSIVLRMKDANMANAMKRGTQMRDDAFSEMMTRTTEEMLAQNPELKALVDSFMTTLTGADAEQYLNVIDPTGLQSTQDQRHQELRRVMSSLQGQLTKPGDSATLKEFHRQGRERLVMFERLHAEWVKENGEPTPGDDPFKMLSEINAKMPTWALDQTQNMALLMNDIVSGYAGVPTELDFWATVPREHGKELIDTIVRRHVIVPASLSDFIVGVLNSPNAEDQDLAQALDFGRALYDIPGINAGKLHASSALGLHGVTLRALFDGMGGSQVQPSKFVREAIERGIKGESPFQSIAQMEEQGLNLTELLREELNDGFTGLFDQFATDEELGPIGNVGGVEGSLTQNIEVPNDFFKSIMRKVQPLLGKYDVVHKDGRKMALREAIRLTIQDEGWAADPRGYSGIQSDGPFLFSFGGFLQQDAGFGISNVIGIGLQKISPDDLVWSRLSPKSLYDEQELVIVDREVDAELKRLFPDDKLKLKENVVMELNAQATNLSGQRTWQFWTKHRDGETRMLITESGGLMTMTFDKAFADMDRVEQQERDRTSLISARARELSQLLSAQNIAPGGIDPEMSKRSTVLIKEIDDIRNLPGNQLQKKYLDKSKANPR